MSATTAKEAGTAAVDPPTWCTMKRLTRETGLSRCRLHTLAISGFIRTRVPLGSSPRFALEDALAVARGER